jgi:methyl-galactoside transport system substrate-binding protein
MAKNKIGLTLALLPSLLVGACARSNPYVSLFVYDLSDTFMHSLQSAIINDLAGAYDCNNPSYDAGGKQSVQNEEFVEELDRGRSNAIVMNTVDRLASSALIEKAEAKKVPLVFINREPLKNDMQKDDWAKENCFYVGGNPTNEGNEQAEIADGFFGGFSSFGASRYDKNKDGKVQVAILKGEEGHQDSEARTASCISKLQGLGYTLEIVATTYCNWKRGLAYEATKNLADKGVELLFANNDEMALGAIQALQEENASSSASEGSFQDKNYPIVGCDGTIEGKAAVKEGYLIGTVLNDAETQAKVVTDLLHYILSGTPLPTYGQAVSASENFYHVTGEKIVA